MGGSGRHKIGHVLNSFSTVNHVYLQRRSVGFKIIKKVQSGTGAESVASHIWPGFLLEAGLLQGRIFDVAWLGPCKCDDDC